MLLASSNVIVWKPGLEPINGLSGVILVAVIYLKWWPQVGWEDLSTKQVDVFLRLKY